MDYRNIGPIPFTTTPRHRQRALPKGGLLQPRLSISDQLFEELPYKPYEARKKQFGVTLKPPVYFSMKGHQGVPLAKALHKDLSGLDHKHTTLYSGCGTKVSFLIQMDGYQPYTHQKYTHTRQHGESCAMDLAKVATQIAEVMSDFIDKRKLEKSSGQYNFGPNGIQLEDLYLLELHHVSKSSFQPVFGILRNASTPLESSDVEDRAECGSDGGSPCYGSYDPQPASMR